MSQQRGPYQIVDFAAARRDTPIFMDMFWWKHFVYGLLEVDVTVARQFIAEHRARTGEVLSFTGYLFFCVARAVDEHKAVHAFLKGRKQLIVFDDVDIGLPIEREFDGKRAPAGHVIRGANHKTYLQIHQEIRAVQSEAKPANKGLPPWFPLFLLLPWPVPRLFGAVMRAANRHDPRITVALGGTVDVTAVGMFGTKSGWGIVPFPQSLGLVVGGIARKPAIAHGQIQAREILSLTVAFDHDVVNGAPAARFVRYLVELIETGYGLAELSQLAYQQVDERENGNREQQPIHQPGISGVPATRR